MFIELTDLLRCPAAHDESYLVLIPGQLEHRRVIRGVLGCPVCRREYPVVEGVAEFGAAGSLPGGPGGAVPFPAADAVLAFLGLGGPGGYVALFGDAARLAEGLAALRPGVHWVAVNPPPDVKEEPFCSLLRAPRSPLKTRSVRGAVLGNGYGADPLWQREAARSVLPGLRVTGPGAPPLGEGLELLAAAAQWWVARVAQAG
ncbi:MAG TPA: Trm112 family protein [Gemmatimonadales bacterium]|nr:Trm112 family protein [Gemmatimonadales bacterium]